MSQKDQQNTISVDGAEPTAGPATVPIWLLVALGVLCYWGSVYLDGHGGGFNREVFEPFTSYAEVSNSLPSNPEGKFMAMGEDMFKKTCSLCHQLNGMGKEGQFPPLAGSDWLLAAGPGRIGRIVLNGLSGPIRVEAGGKIVSLNAAMAPLGVGTDYTDEQLAAALSYVRKQWGNNAAKIAPDEIKAIRAASKAHPGPWSPDELLQMPVTVELPK